MSIADESQFARVLVERLCSAAEIELVRAEQQTLSDKGHPIALSDLLVQRGYITKSQIARLTMAMDEDSMYRPVQQIPGYQILGKVGQGAMAVVFKAKQLSLDRVVAIKVLPKRLSENREFVDRFYREGRAAAKLNHPNIVAAHDVGESGGYHYFVMEYIDGKTVYDLLTDGKPLPESKALDIVLQCAKALDHAHKRGLIHRDVKPKNIMITASGDVKLADMGLAREVGDFATAAAEAGRAYGTPYYISPEQIRGEINIDPRADIYAMGATFYHMVTGKVPFEGSSPTVVMHKHLKEALVPPDHVNHSLSAGIGEIIEVMMAKAPKDRYPSCAELTADLSSVAAGDVPFQARKSYDHRLLESLGKSGQVIERPRPVAQQPSQPGISLHWLLALGLLLLISIVANIILLVD